MCFLVLKIVFKPLYQAVPVVFYPYIPTGVHPDAYWYLQKLAFHIAELKIQQHGLSINLEEVKFVELGNFVTTALARTGNYCSSRNSYILSKTEGTLKKSVGNTNFVYHTGVDSMYHTTIEADKTTQIILYLRGEDFQFKTGQSGR